ncbi:hypothetical protein K7I13_05140 [Brucepastera parasyntrophica]|uniref:hypothetical protein n=1 Tax=Brucepastera parasyntrophica TaxID=2880008 RepID=UPI00210861B2|nr:hypothetical protein [Brucepastera parasyntrophica]ULQ60660.1 hypothetical protein K7I13_05140 [Brucepastera parasyntrophica]
MVKKILIPICIAIVSCIAVSILSFTKLSLLFDIPSFLIVPVLPLLYMAGSFGFRGIGRAYKTAFAKNPEKKDLVFSQAFFRGFSKVLWLFSAVGFVTGLIGIFSFLNDYEVLGPNLAVAIITLFYGVLSNLLLVYPFLLSVSGRLSEFSD